jgi:uncharacterized protein involved in response to NO
VDFGRILAALVGFLIKAAALQHWTKRPNVSNYLALIISM